MKFITTAFVASLLPLSAFAGTYSFSQNTGVFTTTTGIAHGQAVTWGLSGSTNPSNYNQLFADINTSHQVVTSATLTLTNIYDWQGEAAGEDPADSLFVNILGGLNVGVTAKTFISSPSTNDANWSGAVNPFVDVTGTSATDYNDVLQGGTALPFGDAVTGSLLSATTAGSTSSRYALDGNVLTKTATPAFVTWSDPSGGAAGKSTLVINFSAANLAVLTALIDADLATGTPTVGLGFAAECHYYMDGVTLTINTANAPSVPDSGNTLALMGLGLAAMVGFRRLKK